MSRPIKTIEQLWQGYAAAAGVPPGGVQWTETKKAFFGGIAVFLDELGRFPDDQAEGVRLLNRFDKEGQDFLLGLVTNRGARA